MPKHAKIGNRHAEAQKSRIDGLADLMAVAGLMAGTTVLGALVAFALLWIVLKNA